MKLIEKIRLRFFCKILISFVLVIFLFFPFRAHAVPTVFTYTGTMTVNGQAYNGTGYMKMAIITVSGQDVTTLWSNDGTSVSGSQPTSEVEVTFRDGKYVILLGDDGMAAIDPAIFNTSRTLYLRIWFDDGSNSFKQMTPDIQITSAAYAQQAGTATTLDGLSADDFVKVTDQITASQIASQAVTSSKILDNAVTAAKTSFLTTDAKTFTLGNATNGTVSIVADLGATMPAIRFYNGAWEFSNDGSSFSAFGSGGGVGTITGVTAGSGLTGGGANGSVTLDIGAGTGISVAADGISLDYTSNTLAGNPALTSGQAVFDSADKGILFEGTTADTNEGVLGVTTLTGDQTWTLPDATGTIALTSSNISGNATTATALAANGSNCSAGSYPLGVNESGAVEGCTVAATGTVTSVATGTGLTGGTITGIGTVSLDYTNTLALDPALTSGQAVFDSADKGILFEGTTADTNEGVLQVTTLTGDRTWTLPDATGTIALTSSNISGNATTATSLASNPVDCSANQFANAIDASGNLTCAALGDSDISNDITIATTKQLSITKDPASSTTSNASLLVNPNSATTQAAFFAVQDNGADRFNVSREGEVDITTKASSGTKALYMDLSGSTYTNVQAGAELNDVYLRLDRTVTWAAGSNLNTQRAINITQPTYAFAGAQTIGDGATMYIAGAPRAGSNATFTKDFALQIVEGSSVPAAAGLLYSALDISAGTLTLTGGTGVTSTGPAGISIGQLTVTDSTAVSLDTASSLYIAAAPVAAGSAAIGSAYSIWVDAGTSRFDGSVQLGASTGSVAGQMIFYDNDGSSPEKITINPPDGTVLTSDITLTLPNGSGTLVTSGDSQIVTSTMITDGTIAGGDLSSNISITSTGTQDYSGASSFKVPVGTGPTIDAAGKIAVDTTDDQLIFYGGAKRVVPYRQTKCMTVENLTTSDVNVPMFIFNKGATVIQTACYTTSSVATPVYALEHNDNTTILTGAGTCAKSAQATWVNVSANGSFNAGDAIRFDATTSADSSTFTTICIAYTEDAQ